uniref:Uncharacterized protein n=1 Tax=Hucho hucho TaxID=62062 RepID=A0A4W5LND4_9TELE
FSLIFLRYSHFDFVAGVTSENPICRLNGECFMYEPVHGDTSICIAGCIQIKVVYIAHSGQKIPVKAHVEDNILYPPHIHVHEASLACSTCHVYVNEVYLYQMTTRHGEDDMLDMIILTPELEGIGVTLPKVTRNVYVDGHVHYV